MPDDPRGERSLGELFTELARETGTLVRQEIQLATSEMSAKASTAGRNVALIGAGGALAHTGLLAVIAACIYALGVVVPMWLSALIIGLAVVGLGALLISKGVKAIRGIDPVPTRTVMTLRDDRAWVKEQLR